MKYFAPIALAAGFAAADMHAMPAPAAPPAHTMPAVPAAPPAHTMPAVPAAPPAHTMPAAVAPPVEHVMSVAAPEHVGGVATHTVIVGGLKPVETGMAPALEYKPEAITAAQGDKVKFVFLQKNHTVTQSTFDLPCNRMEGGLNSGFQPNAEGAPGVEWEMTVETTDPLWFYCAQGTHCGVGMVFSINAALEGDKTMAAFKQLAIQKNGTEQAPLTTAGINVIAPGGQAAPTTVTVEAGGPGGVHATGTAPAPLGSATVVAGHGEGQGEACQCQCLCGMNSFPSGMAANHFGGYAGMLPSS